MASHDPFKLSQFQRLYAFEKLRKEASLSLGKLAYFSTANEEDSDVLAWTLFVDCCLGKIKHEIPTPLSAFEQDLLSSVTETTLLNFQFCSAYHYYETYQFRTRFFIPRYAYFYWAKNSHYWRELKDNDFIGFWLEENIREHEALCAGLEQAITEIERQSADTNGCDPKEGASHTTPTRAPLTLSTCANSSDPEGLIMDNTIKLGGDFWAVGYQGETRYIKNFSGMHYITYLLQNPGKRFSAAHLERAVNPPEFHSDNSSELLLMSPEQLKEHGLDTWDSARPEPIFDDQGKALLKAHCQKMITRIGELRTRGDHEGVDKLMTELEDIETHINKSTNHLGSSRTLPDETQREINRISKAISRAINKVFTHYQELGSHLEKAIKKGAFFSYEPDAETNWTFLK
ncbi:MAG: hypothetical protein ACXV8O_07295 [Methylobacter sp.]